MAVKVSPEEKEQREQDHRLFDMWISFILDVMGLQRAIDQMSEKVDQVKDKAQAFLREHGSNDGKGHYVWAGVKKGLLHVLKGQSQVSYEVDKNKFVDLVGFETAVQHMQLPAMTNLIKLAETGALMRRDGTTLTEDDIRAIANKETRARLKISFALLPATTSIDEILAKMSKDRDNKES